MREINFGDCLLKTDGAYHFAEALEQNHEQLELLDLGFNEINYDGGLVLVTAVQHKPKLRVFNLDGNCFGQHGSEQIVAQMAKCKNAAALSLDEVVSEEEGEENGADDDDNVTPDNSDEDEASDEQDDDDDQDDDEEYDPNDTTEEVDEDDDEAYVTTNAYTTKVNQPPVRLHYSEMFSLACLMIY